MVNAHSRRRKIRPYRILKPAALPSITTMTLAATSHGKPQSKALPTGAREEKYSAEVFLKLIFYPLA